METSTKTRNKPQSKASGATARKPANKKSGLETDLEKNATVVPGRSGAAHQDNKNGESDKHTVIAEEIPTESSNATLDDSKTDEASGSPADAAATVSMAGVEDEVDSGSSFDSATEEAASKEQPCEKETFPEIGKEEEPFLVRYRPPFFLVYLDPYTLRGSEDFIVRWKRVKDVFKEKPYEADPKQVERVLAKAQTIGAIPTPFLTKDQRETKSRFIGEAVALALCGDTSAANQTLKDARNFIVSKAEEKARIWTVQGAIASFAALLAIFLLLTVLVNPPTIKIQGGVLAVRELLIAAQFGLIGGLFSLLQRVDRLGVAPLSGETPHVVEAFARILSGALGGIIMYVLLRSQLVAGFIQHGDSYNSEHWLTWGLVIVAGLSERLIPNFMTKFETQAAGDVIDGNGASSSESTK